MSEKTLIVRTGPDTLSTAIAGPAATGLEDYEQTPLKAGQTMAALLRETLKATTASHGDVGRVHVLVDAPTLLVPEDEYQPGHASTLYDHTITGHDDEAKVGCRIDGLHCVAVVPVEREMKSLVEERFMQPQWHPLCLPLWKHLHQHHTSRTRQRLYGYIHDDKIEVFRFQQNRFKFCNAFAASQAQDCLYYLLYVFRQLAMDAQHDEVYVAGDLHRGRWLTEHLREHVANVVAADASDLGLSASPRWSHLPLDMLALINQGA